MSELENEIVEDTPELDIEETNTEDSSSDSSDEITYEQAMEWKKKAERLEKAERTLVEQKRKLKEIEKTEKTVDLSDDVPMTKFDFEVERFLDKNPDKAEYRNEIVKYAKEKKLTLAQASILVESEDKTIKNRQKISQSRVSDWESPEQSSYTKDYLAKLDPKNPKDRQLYNRIMDKIDAWKAYLK